MRNQALSTLEMRSREGIGNSMSFKMTIIPSFPTPSGAATMSKLKAAFDAAVAAGVEAIAVRCKLTPESIDVETLVPIKT